MKKLLFAAIVLTGCSKMKEGTVIEKIYQAPDEYMMTQTTYIQSGNTMMPIMSTYWVFDDEDYILKVRVMIYLVVPKLMIIFAM